MATLPVDIYELDFPTDLAVARAGLGPDRVISHFDDLEPAVAAVMGL